MKQLSIGISGNKSRIKQYYYKHTYHDRYCDVLIGDWIGAVKIATIKNQRLLK